MTSARLLRRLRGLRAELRYSGLAAWRALVELVNSNDLTHAASIAYYALLSLFPFLLLVISLLGSIAADDDDRIAVLTFVFRYFPTQLDFVSLQLDAFRQTRVQVGVAGGLGLIWASLGVFGAITSAVNEAWGVEKQRSFWKHRMVSFLMLVAAGGVIMLALVAVSAVQVAEASWFGLMLSRFRWLAAFQSWILPLCRDDPSDHRGWPRLLLHPQREDAIPRRLGRRRLDRGSLDSGLPRLFVVHRQEQPAHAHTRVDCSRRRVPVVDLRLFCDPHVRRGVHRSLCATEAPAAGRYAGRADAAGVIPTAGPSNMKPVWFPLFVEPNLL